MLKRAWAKAASKTKFTGPKSGQDAWGNESRISPRSRAPITPSFAAFTDAGHFPGCQIHMLITGGKFVSVVSVPVARGS